VYTASSAATAPIAQATPAIGGNTEQVGMLLYTNYLIAFEVASMLLLAAMVGAILFARKAD
jgi:NADH:ubiquinone oxidoreductase subunit 6 (subunit J)